MNTEFSTRQAFSFYFCNSFPSSQPSLLPLSPPISCIPVSPSPSHYTLSTFSISSYTFSIFSYLPLPSSTSPSISPSHYTFATFSFTPLLISTFQYNCIIFSISSTTASPHPPITPQPLSLTQTSFLSPPLYPTC